MDTCGKVCINVSLEFNNLLFSDELELAVFEASRAYFYKDLTGYQVKRESFPKFYVTREKLFFLFQNVILVGM